MSSQETNSYPNVSDRVKATITDSAVLLGLMVLSAQIFRHIPNVNEEVRMAAFIFIFVLYDLNNLRVKRESDETKNISIILALIRYIFKFGLGWLSLIAVSRSDKRKAIHDSVVSSVVVYYKKPINYTV